MTRIEGFEFTSDYDTNDKFSVALYRIPEDLYPERDNLRIKNGTQEIVMETKHEVQQLIDALTKLKGKMSND